MRAVREYLFPFRSAVVLCDLNNITNLTNTLFSPNDATL